MAGAWEAVTAVRAFRFRRIEAHRPATKPLRCIPGEEPGGWLVVLGDLPVAWFRKLNNHQSEQLDGLECCISPFNY
jgi:hypothetical protein